MFHPAFVVMSFEVLFFFSESRRDAEIRGPQDLSSLPNLRESDLLPSVALTSTNGALIRP
jgi:hypothetical protein